MTDPEVVFRSLATLLQAGVPLGSGALERGLPPAARGAVKTALSRGSGLGLALANGMSLPAHERVLLEAGEKAGNLPAILDLLADGRSERKKLRRRTLLALAYPTLVLLAAGIFLPLPVLFTSGFLAYLGWALPLPALVAAVLVYTLIVLPRVSPSSPLHTVPTAVARATPLLGTSLVYGPVSLFAEVLGRCQKSGVPISLSVPAALRASGDPRWAGCADEVRERVDQGASLDEALIAVPGMPAGVHQQIALGETTGKLDDMLLAVAKEARARHGRVLMVIVALVTAAALMTAALVAIAGIVGAAKTFYIDPMNDVMKEIDDPFRPKPNPPRGESPSSD